jgi:hypothetical protein
MAESVTLEEIADELALMAELRPRMDCVDAGTAVMIPPEEFVRRSKEWISRSSSPMRPGQT